MSPAIRPAETNALASEIQASTVSQVGGIRAG
jgi:hypothetical protein